MQDEERERLETALALAEAESNALRLSSSVRVVGSSDPRLKAARRSRHQAPLSFDAQFTCEEGWSEIQTEQQRRQKQLESIKMIFLGNSSTTKAALGSTNSTSALPRKHIKVQTSPISIEPSPPSFPTPKSNMQPVFHQRIQQIVPSPRASARIANTLWKKHQSPPSTPSSSKLSSCHPSIESMLGGQSVQRDIGRPSAVRFSDSLGYSLERIYVSKHEDDENAAQPVNGCESQEAKLKHWDKGLASDLVALSRTITDSLHPTEGSVGAGFETGYQQRMTNFNPLLASKPATSNAFRSKSTSPSSNLAPNLPLRSASDNPLEKFLENIQ